MSNIIAALKLSSMVSIVNLQLLASFNTGRAG
jgi:hypothetical protein